VRPYRIPLVLATIATGVLVPWLVLMAVCGYRGQDFPLNDDWAYALGAFAFARGEGLHYQGWSSAALLGQWLWAFPFIRCLGESHVALRLSTLVLSGIGLAAFVDLLRGAGVAARTAALAGAALALNPLYFLMAGTFMSDVPALAFSLVALALYQRAFASRQAVLLGAVAALFAVAAVTTRQNAVAVPAAVGLLLVARPDLRSRAHLWIAVLVPVSAALWTSSWMNARADVLNLHPRLPAPQECLLLLYCAAHMSGLAAIPLLLAPSAGSRKAFVVALAVMLCGAAWLRLSRDSDGLFPYVGNVLTPVGAERTEDELYIPGEEVRPLVLGAAGQSLVTLVGCLGAAALVARAARLSQRWQSAGLLAAFSLVHVLILVVSPQLFDRYLIVLMPGALAVAALSASAPSPRRELFVWAALAASGAVSVALMHDWLAWNTARWTLGRRALASGIPPAAIEGGFEWDGWFAGGVDQARQRPPQALVLRADRLLFPGVTGHYALSFAPLRHSITRDSQPYQLWLPREPRRFFLIEIEPGARAQFREPDHQRPG
jgi:hypothetical protein